MSGTTHRRSLQIAQEGSFGQIDTTTGLPTLTGLTFVSVEGDRSDIATIGEPVITTREELRSSFYQRPDEMITMKDGSGNLVQRRKGSLTLNCRMRNVGATPGAVIDGVANLPGYWMLNSSLQAFPYGSTQVVDSAASATSFVSNTTPAASVGSVLAYDYQGRRHYTGVTDFDSGTDTYTVSPALPVTPSAAQTLFGSYFLGIPTGTMTVGPSLAFKLDGDGWETLAFGCRLESVEISWDLDGEAMWAFTFSCSHIQDNHASAAIVDPVRPSGHVVHPLGANHVISSTRSDGAGPLALARTRLAVESGSVTINFTLAPCGDSLTILGMSNLEVTDVMVEISLTLCTVLALVANDYRDGVPRSLMLSFGPTGAGEGAYIYVPSAVMTSDPNIRDLGGDAIKQVLNYKVGLWIGDEPTGDGEGENTMFRIGFPLDS